MTRRTSIVKACLLGLPLTLTACAVVPLGAQNGTESLADPIDNPGGLDRTANITAVGYAVVGVQQASSPEQRRLMAMRASKLDAYRSLAEQVYGQYVNSTTTIEDLTIMDDRFKSRVEGVIFGARLVSIEPVGEDSYQTTMRLDRQAVSDLRRLYLQYFVKGATQS